MNATPPMSSPEEFASLCAALPPEQRRRLSTDDLGACYRWAIDTQRDNASEPETAAHYFPHCVAQLIEERGFDASRAFAGMIQRVMEATAAPAPTPTERPRFRRGHR